MREMLCEAIQAKYGTRRLKPVPLSGPTCAYAAVDESLTDKQKKTEHHKPPIADENTNNSNDSGTDCSDDMEMDMSCCVCKSVMFHGWNPIVECAECHACYHKECHDPEIMEDISDPRVVWYCRNCNKALQSKTKSLPPITIPNSSKTVTSSGKHSNSTNRSNSPPVATSFSNKSSFGGKRTLHNKLSVLSSSSGKLHNPKINIISADRRLQIMKKRAARKQDKRSNK
ncbi:hypothetical protein GE061_001520 [Apolygus lucorum]|uniref:Uncharacterized protein n=1 Tax=Apolygus lucorum TaxID=248454 RepID=A0A6A4KIF3_APOLU|nr:hypothetical protein GE061_001520 [Apolygus lucorum]